MKNRKSTTVRRQCSRRVFVREMEVNRSFTHTSHILVCIKWMRPNTKTFADVPLNMFRMWALTIPVAFCLVCCIEFIAVNRACGDKKRFRATHAFYAKRYRLWRRRRHSTCTLFSKPAHSHSGSQKLIKPIGHIQRKAQAMRRDIPFNWRDLSFCGYMWNFRFAKFVLIRDTREWDGVCRRWSSGGI